LLLRLPAGLKGAPVDLRTWVEVGRSRIIVLLLAVTMLQMSGQFVVFTFMGPLLKKLTDAGPDAIGLVFSLYGVFGFLGVAVATRIVDTWGPYRTSVLFMSLVLAGIAGWAVSAGTYLLMAAAVAIWGLGFAATNSMQQVRLVAAAPALASATVSLNTSVLYIGQAVGSAVGGLLFAGELLHTVGFVAAGFVVLALTLVGLTRPRPAVAAAAAA
jgi:predicted MFS family arabinose efflux permease